MGVCIWQGSDKGVHLDKKDSGVRIGKGPFRKHYGGGGFSIFVGEMWVPPRIGRI